MSIAFLIIDVPLQYFLCNIFHNEMVIQNWDWYFREIVLHQKSYQKVYPPNLGEDADLLDHRSVFSINIRPDSFNNAKRVMHMNMFWKRTHHLYFIYKVRISIVTINICMWNIQTAFHIWMIDFINLFCNFTWKRGIVIMCERKLVFNCQCYIMRTSILTHFSIAFLLPH